MPRLKPAPVPGSHRPGASLSLSRLWKTCVTYHVYRLTCLSTGSSHIAASRLQMVGRVTTILRQMATMTSGPSYTSRRRMMPLAPMCLRHAASLTVRARSSDATAMTIRASPCVRPRPIKMQTAVLQHGRATSFAVVWATDQVEKREPAGNRPRQWCGPTRGAGSWDTRHLHDLRHARRNPARRS